MNREDMLLLAESIRATGTMQDDLTRTDARLLGDKPDKDGKLRLASAHVLRVIALIKEEFGDGATAKYLAVMEDTFVRNLAEGKMRCPIPGLSLDVWTAAIKVAARRHPDCCYPEKEDVEQARRLLAVVGVE